MKLMTAPGKSSCRSCSAPCRALQSRVRAPLDPAAPLVDRLLHDGTGAACPPALNAEDAVHWSIVEPISNSYKLQGAVPQEPSENHVPT